MGNPMFNIPYGLYVVTSRVDEHDNGCISNTLQQVTALPNQVSLCLNKDGFTCEMIRKSGLFTASIIDEDADFELFKHFGFQSGRDVDKFKDFKECRRVADGTLAITRGCNTFISCKVTRTIDLGSHYMFIGDVMETGILSKVPSATYSFYQEFIKPKPEEKKITSGRVAWRCKICGYIYEESEELPADFICPICKHPASDFEKIFI